MDFGDILSQWDSMPKGNVKNSKGQQKSAKKANARSYEKQMEADNQKRMNPMEIWLNQHGVVDKDKIADEAKNEQKFHDREFLKHMAPDATIDLHGLTRDEAWSRLESFVSDSVRRGFRKIMIIHGKGNHSHGSDPVLGPMVRQFIEQNQRLGTSAHPDRNNGGTGATWVLIKNF